MTLKTLVDACVRSAGDTCRDHLKVHHVVARRRLMTLGTIHGAGRWMLKLRYRPAVGGVALSAVVAEQFEVAVVIAVARRAVQH